MSAAKSILDRRGNVAQPPQSGDDPLTMIHRIERMIVHPEEAPEPVLDCERSDAHSAGD